MASVSEALSAAAARLSSVSDTPRLDAELLMAEALAVPRETLLLASLDAPAPETFTALVDRRFAHEPIAYILGRRGFWTIELAVGPGVLVPRPDSETLLDAAVAHFGKAAPRRILDLGTGPGTLLLAALNQWPDAHGLGADTSPAAEHYFRINAEALGLAARVIFRRGDWGEGIDGAFDLILCNPPYVETGADLPADVRDWEPSAALYAGADGLDDHRRLAPQIARLLAPDGIACVEIGAGQAPAATALYSSAGLRVGLRKDLAAHDRCLILRY